MVSIPTFLFALHSVYQRPVNAVFYSLAIEKKRPLCKTKRRMNASRLYMSLVAMSLLIQEEKPQQIFILSQIRPHVFKISLTRT